jgi:hypothetical protein
MTTNIQEFHTLLDRLTLVNAQFIKTAKRFTDRRGRRSIENQKAPRVQLDNAIDALIAVYVKCEASIDALAAADDLPAAFRGQPDNHHLVLWRRAACTAALVADEQIDALADIAGCPDGRAARGWNADRS